MDWWWCQKAKTLLPLERRVLDLARVVFSFLGDVNLFTLSIFSLFFITLFYLVFYFSLLPSLLFNILGVYVNIGIERQTESIIDPSSLDRLTSSHCYVQCHRNLNVAQRDREGTGYRIFLGIDIILIMVF